MKNKALLSGLAGLTILTVVGCGNANTVTGGTAPTNTTHQAVTNTTGSQPGFTAPSVSSIQTITIRSYGVDAGTWITYDPKSVAHQIVNWLNRARPVSSKNLQAKVANHSVEMNLETTGGSTTVIFPAYTTQGSPVGDVIAYKSENGLVYVSSHKLYEFLVREQYPTEFLPKPNPMKNVPFTRTQLVSMTAQQLATYNIKHHTPLPFAGSKVVRDIPKQPIMVTNPKSATIDPPIAVKGHTLNPNDFYVIDRWSCTIPGNPDGIGIEIDKSKDGSEYVVGVANGPRVKAYVFKKEPYITNFTGRFIVFATPNPAQGNPFYAIDLQTGSLNTAQAYKISNDYGIVGGASGNIQGLSQPYFSQTNG